MSKPLISYEYDQDPRYGWVSVDTEDRKSLLFVVDNNGFIYEDGTMKPTCICYARSENECGCSNMFGKWDDWGVD